MDSINRLAGSSRKPKAMVVCPAAIQRTEYCSGAVMDQWRASSARAAAAEMATAAMESPADRRARGRVKRMMRANATAGSRVAVVTRAGVEIRETVNVILQVEVF